MQSRLSRAARDQVGGEAFGGAAPAASSAASAAQQLDPPLTYLPDSGAATLVMYVYANSDSEARGNLEHFIREGMWRGNEDLAVLGRRGGGGGSAASSAGGGVDYLILLQHDGGRNSAAAGGRLPALPPNARYVHHENECYDWGTFGWLLDQEPARAMLVRYRHFIFLNSSVRGPFMPTYLRGLMHWSDAFTNLLTDGVGLVGPSINCEGAVGDEQVLGPSRGDVHGALLPWTPHVQSYAMATDAAGLEVLRRGSSAFHCHSGRLEAIRQAEVGASAAALAAGHNIASFQLKYPRSLDWRGRELWGCNGGVNPTTAATHYDGGPLEPLEAMFVKFKAGLSGQDAPWVRKARSYEQWRLQEDIPADKRDVSGNNVYAEAEVMSQRYIRGILRALHGPEAGDPSRLGNTQPVGSMLAEPPDSGHGLPAEMRPMYAAYVGQFV